MSLLDKAHFQRARQSAAEHGVEVTPDECEKMIRESLRSVRDEMRQQGYAMPESDTGMFLLMWLIYRHRK